MKGILLTLIRASRFTLTALFSKCAQKCTLAHFSAMEREEVLEHCFAESVTDQGGVHCFRLK